MPSKKKSRVAGGERRTTRTNQDLQIEALSKRVNKLESALDTNTSIFSDAMKVLEIKNNVLEGVISMLHRDGAGLIETADGNVDFGYYLKRYLEDLGAKEVQAAEAPVSPPPSPVSLDSETTTIFGGEG